MSSGLAICSICNREVHQDGPPKYPDRQPGFRETTWTHCEDKTPRCENASSVGIMDYTDVKGKYCGRDE